jgi:uncharacterized protein YyaL (SSP411 family)
LQLIQIIRNILLTCTLAFSFNLLAAQSARTLKERADSLHTLVYKYFYDAADSVYYETNQIRTGENKYSYLWPLCALIQAANEQEALHNSDDFMSPVLKAIQQYHSTIPPAPGYQAYVTKEKKDSRFYDDNQWIGIACLDAYNRTHEKKYLDIGKEIYRFMMTGFDTLSGGGLYWREDKKNSKNTCSNGPGIIVALELYKITHQESYLDTALILYDWVNAHLRSPSGLYYDNLHIPSLQIDSAMYTYNAGTMLQSNVLLYQVTGEKKYLKEAEQIASSVKNHFYKNNTLPANYWFNAVLLRGEIALYHIDKNRDHLNFFIKYADKVWNEQRDKSGLIGKPGKRKALIDQAAMIEIYARLAQLDI